MKAKKIIKGILGLGVVSGVAYLAYKIGEGSGESNERFREKYDEEDDSEPPKNYYGTCFESKCDEPDDGCLAPDEDEYVEPHEDFYLYDNILTNASGYDEECGSDDHFYTRLRNLDSGDVPMQLVLHALAIVKEFSWITNKILQKMLDCPFGQVRDILNIFEKAGYISPKNSRCRHKVYIKDMDFENLI